MGAALVLLLWEANYREKKVMNTQLRELKKERTELQRQIAALEGQRNALYMPGITIVPQQGTAPTEIDQQLEQLRAAIVELDGKIAAAEQG